LRADADRLNAEDPRIADVEIVRDPTRVWAWRVRGGGAAVSRSWRTLAAAGSWGLNKKKDEGAELFCSSFSDPEKSCSLRQAQTTHGHISRLTR